MSGGDGPWVHLELAEDFYRTFEVPPVPMPIRVETVEAFTERKLELSMEVLATELLAYLERRPTERLRYRAIFGKLAMSVGTGASHGRGPGRGSSSTAATSAPCQVSSLSGASRDHREHARLQPA